MMYKVKQLIELGRYHEAQRVLKPLAESNDIEAQFLLGYLLFTSADVSLEESEKWLKAAAEQGHAEAIYYIAITLFDNENNSFTIGILRSDEDRLMLRKAAEMGSALAQRDLGCFISVGDNGFQKDETEGRRWYLEAARNGHVDAQYNVGQMMLNGEGGEKDVKQALYWIEKCAMAEDGQPASIEASDVLALIYKEGLHGVERDKAVERIWLNRRDELEKAFKKKLENG